VVERHVRARDELDAGDGRTAFSPAHANIVLRERHNTARQNLGGTDLFRRSAVPIPTLSSQSFVIQLGVMKRIAAHNTSWEIGLYSVFLCGLLGAACSTDSNSSGSTSVAGFAGAPDAGGASGAAIGGAGASGSLAAAGSISSAGSAGDSASVGTAGSVGMAGSAVGGGAGCPGNSGGAAFVGGQSPAPTTAAADTIKSVTPSAPEVELYHPLKIEVVTSQTFKNGFDPDEVTVDAVFTPSCGLPITQPCFYEASANGQANWQCRFAPRVSTDYSYSIVLKEGSGVTSSASFMLATMPTTSEGFLHSDTAHAVAPNSASLYDFRFDSGKAWRGVGEDVAWEIGQYKFTAVIPRLHANNLNLFRIWHKSNSLPIEWSSLNAYSQSASAYFDQIVTLAEQNGVYMMVSLNDYRDVSDNWANNPYNANKGGPCTSQNDFFVNQKALSTYKKKLRYYVARWGYSPAIQSFELFNEIDNALGSTNIKGDDVATWTDQMATYLKGIDPYNHLVTSSVSYQSMTFWKSKSIDFTQTHLYGPDNKILNLPKRAQDNIDTYNKPYACGEMGARWESATAATPDQNKQDLHYGMWLGMMQPTPIVPMTWWWDSFWGWGDDYVFKSAAIFSNDLVEKTGVGIISKANVSATPKLETGALTTGKYVYAWVSNHNPGTGTVDNVTLSVSGLTGNAQYSVESFDTWQGTFGTPTTASAQNGVLSINVGSLKTSDVGSDAAYRVTDLSMK
jgi:hypothetical protein